MRSAFRHGAPAFLIMLVSYRPLGYYFYSRVFTASRPARARNGHQATQEIRQPPALELLGAGPPRDRRQIPDLGPLFAQQLFVRFEYSIITAERVPELVLGVVRAQINDEDVEALLVQRLRGTYTIIAKPPRLPREGSRPSARRGTSRSAPAGRRATFRRFQGSGY